MEKEFVSYEIVIALKELGFDEPCLNRFYTKPQSKMFGVDEKSRHYPIKNTSKKLYTMGEHFVLNDSNVILAPTFSQAFRWFREKYGLHTWITSKTNDKGETVYIPHGRTLPDTTKNSLIVDIIPYYTGKSSEEAELECLKKLIEICKK